jgi:hypothetical protein
VSAVKNSNVRTWLWRFEFNIEQAYVLEFGDQYIRFYSNHGVVESSPGVPLEVATPWAAADLTTASGTFALRFVQSGDILYITHPDYKQQKLTRTGAASFTLEDFEPSAGLNGPFKDVESTETITVYSDVATGVAVLTSSAPLFDAAKHNGVLMLLEQKSADATLMWESGKTVAINDIRQSDGKNYKALTAGVTGTIKPVHTFGAKFDGAVVQWEFQDPGYGWLRISNVNNSTTAAAAVLSRLPAGTVGASNATTRWAFGAWSDDEGWPDNVTFFRERLCFSRDRQVWASKSGDFENFNRKDDGGQIVADGALVIDVTSDRANRIEWLAPVDLGLLIGTAGDEQILTEITRTEPFGPGNIWVRKQTERGSRPVAPVKVGEGVVFVQKSGRKVRDMIYSWERESYVSGDMTILSEHVARGGIVGMDYQQEPDSVVWAHRADGQLIGFTLNRDQDVRGWHPHRIGGYTDSRHKQFAAVESVVVIPSPDGESDELWMIVRRLIDGQVQRYVEWSRDHHEEGDDQEDAHYVDSGLILDNSINATLTPGTGADVKDTTDVLFITSGSVFVPGDVGRFIHYRYSEINGRSKVIYKTAVAEITQFVSVNTVKCTINYPWPDLDTIPAMEWRMTVTQISGLDHLVGETVAIWADGAVHAQKVVNASGQITLDVASSKVHVGLPCPAILTTMPLEGGAQDGTSQGKVRRPHRVKIRFHETIGVKYGREEDTQLDEIQFRSPDDPMDIALPLFTGDKEVSWPVGYEREATVTILQDQPGPCTVVSIMPDDVVQDRG